MVCPGRPFDLRVEHRDRAVLDLGARSPRLSWRLPDGAATQQSYAVEVDGHGHPPVASASSVLVPWPGAPLPSRHRATWRVKVWTDVGESDWSEPAWFETGLDAGDWIAAVASPDVPLEATALLRRAFTVTGPVASARLHLTAHGVVEAELNGRRVGDHVLDPGWTSYGHRLRYRTIDVTDLLVEGDNVLGARVSDGWFRGRLGFGEGRSAVYGDRLGLIAQLELVGSDGGRTVVATDDRWRWAPGPTTRASLYDGEHHDARLEPRGWSSPGFDDGAWAPVTAAPSDATLLVAPTGPPVRITETVPVVATTTSPSGRTIADFGQNLVGRLRIRVDGAAGEEVVLRHAEILEDGELCTEPLRVVEATDRYFAAGDDGGEAWAPRFTFHGFRYAELTGPVAEVVAEVCHSDLRRTGWFSCSDERVDQLHRNVVWGMRGNFLDVPTDCPQRDERLGWTGDLTVFSPTACFLYDVAGLLDSWLEDVAAEQDETGALPLVVPDVLGYTFPTAVWGDAVVDVPWTLHQRFGDPEPAVRLYPNMVRWLELIESQWDEQGHWAARHHLGDWLDPAAPPDNPGAGRTDPHLVANAWYCQSLGRVAQIAALAGLDADVDRWRTVEAQARAEFGRRYVHADGTMASDSQTAYALAIRLGLVDGDRRVTAGERLVTLVEAEGHRIGTGFVGTPLVCDALCDVGAVDTAYELLLQTECPSWLYPLQHGATTVWERWDGIRPDGTRNPGEMNSFNHYALGAVADWLHRSVAGLAPAEPGYRRLRIRPLPGRRLDHAEARHDTPYGRAEAGWRRVGNEVVVHATVPPGTMATIELPDGRVPFDAAPGTHEWKVTLP